MKELRKSLVIGGERYALAVGQAGGEPPGEDTPGKVGVTYLDTAADPPALYACTAAVRDGERIRCSWVRVGGAGEDSGQNATSLTLTSPNGAKWAVTVSDDGILSAIKQGASEEPDAGGDATENITQTGSLLTIVSVATEPVQSGSVLTVM